MVRYVKPVIMRKLLSIILPLLIIAIAIVFQSCSKSEVSSGGLRIVNPFDNSLFPAEFPSPSFEWVSDQPGGASWEVSLSTGKNKFKVVDLTETNRWQPRESAWDSIKSLSELDRICFKVRQKGNNNKHAQVCFRISSDSVGASVLYRQMPIPFVLAEKQLDSMNFMLIDPGSREAPHFAMKGFPVCGNCHSISLDGKTIGLDLDAGRRDKGGYFIAEIKDTITFDIHNFMSWSKKEQRSTFGLFSKVSPDGRYVVTTVKDRVISYNPPLNTAESFAYSQLFFPVNGHLAVYDRQTGILKELPGADSEEYVHSNAFWNPDGKSILFSRAKALPRGSDPFEIAVRDQKIQEEFAARRRTFKYDIYSIPFNGGNGGTAVPVEGASNNGKSNYFPAVSPDGKWLVYCQADNFMNLMPDSRLYIIPAGGGKPRKMRCNFNAMNSWHSWSPNSKWVVYSSKGLSYFTDLLLTHIDENGNASIPVLLDKARADHRVCNYPEFINRDPKDKFTMAYDYVELAHIRMALKDDDIEKAKRLFYQLMDQKPFFFSEDYSILSGYLFRMGLLDEAAKYAQIANQAIKSNIAAE
jgi:hypothetical protein